MNIRYEHSTQAAFESFYLKKRLKELEVTLGVSFNGISWVIYDTSKNVKVPWILQDHRNRYGFCYPKKKEIWIARDLIVSYERSCMMRGVQQLNLRFFPCMFEKVYLLDYVITDELAHLKTGRNHGDYYYEQLLSRYRRKLG